MGVNVGGKDIWVNVDFLADEITSDLHDDAVADVLYLVFVFFFSSRRRHTRFDCDWSSDVCSSDLKPTRLYQRDRCAGDLPRPSACSSRNSQSRRMSPVGQSPRGDSSTVSRSFGSS